MSSLWNTSSSRTTQTELGATTVIGQVALANRAFGVVFSVVGQPLRGKLPFQTGFEATHLSATVHAKHAASGTGP